MRATGYVRAVDELGRIVLPIELRRSLAIAPKDDIEIYMDSGDIVLEKYLPACVFCGEHEELVDFKGRLVCRECSTSIETSRSRNVYTHPDDPSPSLRALAVEPQ